MDPNATAFRVLDFAADAFDVVLTLLALAVPWLQRPWRGWPAAGSYVLAGLAGLGVVYGAQALDLWWGLWSVWGLDYSTHTAYAVSLATSIASWHRRWTWSLGAAVLGYGVLLMMLGFHGLVDILTSAALAGVGTWIFQRLAARPDRDALAGTATPTN
jgi:hypothetical protein